MGGSIDYRQKLRYLASSRAPTMYRVPRTICYCRQVFTTGSHPFTSSGAVRITIEGVATHAQSLAPATAIGEKRCSQEMTMYDLIIIGGGPAAVSAACYALEKRINFVMLFEELGGQV